MRRLGRIIYFMATSLSLLLSLASAGVWARSMWLSDQLEWYSLRADGSYRDRKSIWCSRGGIRFDAVRFFYNDSDAHCSQNFEYNRERAMEYPAMGDKLNRITSKSQREAFLGFEWIPPLIARSTGNRSVPVAMKFITIPLYFPTLIFALLPAHFLLRFRRQRRIAAHRVAKGRCAGCGYDLRASPNRCPECGMPVRSNPVLTDAKS